MLQFDILTVDFQFVLSRHSPNRPFYRYGGYIELVRFKEYYGMPRGHPHDTI